ncbi:MAG: hypothetical protein HC812_17810 [Leptolyngbya sp. RL_3_1]|nr:hypothetical protein [Leptolyngbya sp. RL_3_1]
MCPSTYDKLTFIYIELPKFTKTVDQLESHFDKWLFLLKHLPDLTEPPQPLQEDIFNQLFEVAEVANFSPVEQDSYQESLKYYRDLNNVVDTSWQEGKAEGRAEGKAEGRAEGRAEGQQEGIRQVARQMKAAGMSSQNIGSYTGLTADEIERL